MNTRKLLALTRAGAILQTAFCTYNIILGPHGITQHMEYTQTIARLEQEIQETTRACTNLAQEIELSNTDPFFKERRARMLVHMGRKGEQWYLPKPSESAIL